MSGITGLLRLDGPPADSCALARAVESLRHRGPDGSGEWTSGPVALGHLLFHTTPESLREALPLEDGPLAITADARIDNREELMDRLHLDRETSALTDPELILAAYAAWGERCVESLVGDFAFAIWDGREEKLFCARDHFGVRPLYYHHAPGALFAFGSEIKAVLAGSGIPKRVNEIRLADFLAGLREDAESTIYEGVQGLPNAHVLVVGRSGLRMWKYYTLAPAADLGPLTDEEYAERFRGLFTEAVRCRTRSAFPIGAQLSGGLDSSSVACVARDVLQEERRGPVHTFSLLFDAVSESDERAYINAVLAQGGFEPHVVMGDDLSPLGNLDEVYDTLDEGLIGGTQHLVWALLKASREAGVRVVLDGIDGDNVVGHGQLRLKELAVAGDWATFAQEVKTLRQRYRAADHRQEFENDLSSPRALFSVHGLPHLDALAERGSWWEFATAVLAAGRHFAIKRRALLKRVWRSLIVPYPVLRSVRAWKARRRAQPRVLPGLIAPQFAERLNVRERFERFPPLEERMRLDRVRDTQLQVLDAARMAAGLEIYDHCGAALGLDIRHPFFDKRLVEFCLALPARQSLQNGWTRSILRRALAHTLPEAVAWRVGKGWMVPAFRRGLFELDAERLKTHVTSLGWLAEYVDPAHLREMYEQGPELPTKKQVELATLATLSLWMKKRFPAGPVMLNGARVESLAPSSGGLLSHKPHGARTARPLAHETRP